MFSPAVHTAPAAPATRSSRRRPRPHSAEGSLPQPKAKRLRSALTKETFTVPDDAVDPVPEPVPPPVNTIARRQSSTEPAPRRELAVRSKKAKVGERGNNKGDGSVLLTANNAYTVSRLPAWPDRLQTEAGAPQHGAIYSDSGYALSLSHTHAVVWPYAVNIASPETFTFSLADATKHASDPLPLGTLTSPSAASTEPGLVVVMPTTGKVTYWESITSAATLDLIRQQRSGVEGAVPGLFSGETVISILNAESAGYLLGFSSGRLAYLSVRDNQGRPSISVQMLKNSGGPSSGGLFGSLRNALSSTSWRGDLATLKAGRSTQIGEREAIVATSKGRIQVWSLSRGGHNAVQREVEAREALVTSIKDAEPALHDLYIESFELLDLVHVAQPKLDDGTAVLLLCSLGDQSRAHYFLIQAVVNDQSLDIRIVQPIRSYTTLVSKSATSKPRLYLPNPGLMAYVVFDRAVVVIAVATSPVVRNSKDRAKTFEDVIDFRSSGGIEIVGSGMEEPHSTAAMEDSKSRKHKAKYPATMLYVKGGGVLRVASTNGDRLRGKSQPVTAKSKLEQAVFFGSLKHNPLDFSGRAEIQFSSQAVCDAALELSQEILSSTTPLIPSVGGSMEFNMQRRAVALSDLAQHLKRTGADLDRLTRWKLLWDAERLAAAAQIWRLYDARVKVKASGASRSILADVVECIHEDWKKEPTEEAGELDRVRFWFVNDIWRLEIAIPWAFQALKYRYEDGEADAAMVLELLSEVDDFVIGGLETAFDFRAANLDAYGLSGEEVKDGVLQSGYEGLPEFWSSSIFIVQNLERLAEFASSFIRQCAEQATPNLKSTTLDKVRREIVTLVDLNCRCNAERAFWGMQQSNPQVQAIGQEIWRRHQETRDTELKGLAEIGLIDEAIVLSEKHEVFNCLVAIVLAELRAIKVEMTEPGIDEDRSRELDSRFAFLENLLHAYFDRYGERWAVEFYNYYIDEAMYGSLLDDNQEYQNFVTKYLRSKPEYGKLAWINEIVSEKDFSKASKILLDLGHDRERDLWSKKVELSIGKLAQLADQKPGDSKALVRSGVDETATQRDLALARIQDQAFRAVQPSIRAAIDEKAELQLALEIFGRKTISEHNALSSLLEENMRRLLAHEAMDAMSLVELLTLMGPADDPADDGLCGQDFVLALEALATSECTTEEREITERAIWRRCLIRDDWKEINNTEQKGDEEVANELARTALFMTLRTCYKERLFDDPSPLKPISPSAILDAHTIDFDTRYQALDANARDSLIADMKAEEDQLKSHVKSCRLDKWFEEAMALAKASVEEEMKEKTLEGEQTNEAEKQLQLLEARIAQESQQAALKLLQSKPRYKPKPKFKVNGVLTKLKSSAVKV